MIKTNREENRKADIVCIEEEQRVKYKNANRITKLLA